MSAAEERISYLPSEGMSYDPEESKYWDSKALKQEVDRAFEICHGCRMCFKFCDSFPNLFKLLDEKYDGKVSDLQDKDVDHVMDACFQCKLCEVQCPYTPRDGHEFQLDFPKLVHRYNAQKAKKKDKTLRDRVLGDPDGSAKLARMSFGMANTMNRVKFHRVMMEKVLGIHRDKDLPDFSAQTFEKQAESKNLMTKENPETVLFHALGAWRVRKAFHDLLWNPAFLIPAYQLLGKGIRFFHDQLFCKPANHGSVVSWHQDYSYWTWTKPMNHLTCWIGLDDSNEENGCLHYVPGSHRWGLIDKLDLAGEMDAVRDLLTPEQIRDFEKKTPIVMKAGYASFHHPVLMHGSFENRSPSQRRATVINVFGDGVVSNLDFDTVNAPGTKNYPAIPVGEKMRGSYYPLLFNPEKEFKNAENIIPKLGGLNS